MRYVARLLYPFFLLIPCLGFASQVERWVLDNGDEIHATWISSIDGLVILDHPVMGQLQIEQSRITRIQALQDSINPDATCSTPPPDTQVPVPEPAPVLASGSDEKPAATPQAPITIIPSLTAQPTPVSLWTAAERALNSIAHKNRPSWYPTLPDNWDGSFKFGFTYNERETLSSQKYGEFNLDGKIRQWNHRLKAHYLFADQAGIQNDNRWGGSYRLRWEKSEKSFLQSATSFESDELKDPHYKTILSVGVGNKWINTPNCTLDWVIGAAGEHRTFRHLDDDNLLRLHLNEELRWKLNDALQLKQSLAFLASPDDLSKHSLRFDASVETLIIGALNLEVSYRFDYDPTLENPASRRRTLIVTSFGLKF